MNKDSKNNNLENSPVTEPPVDPTPHVYNKYLNNNLTNNIKEKEEERTLDRKKTVKDFVREFITLSDGVFTLDDIIKECGLYSDKRNAVKCALSDFIAEGLIERRGLRSGSYSPIKSTGIHMNESISSAKTTPVTMYLPLAIDALLNIHNRNLIVIQGLSNAGKTAFLMEIARLNRKNFSNIKYINTEMDASEIKDRIERRNMDVEEFLSFVSFYLVKNTHLDGAVRYEIEPNGLNLVDYLHLQDATLMATEMDKIQERLENGIAVVAIQKYLGKDMGYGGYGVKNRARLLIDLSKDIATLKKVKSPLHWHKEIKVEDAYRRFEYDRNGTIKPKTPWFTADNKAFRIFSNGLAWEEDNTPIPDDEFVEEK